jgi:Carboxypeptidase regulatory-like domain
VIALALELQPPAPSEVTTGIVRDPSGDVIRDADVKLIAPQQRVAAAARTGDQGTFTLTVREAGDYLIVISAPGFNEVRRPCRSPPADSWNSRSDCRSCTRT